MSGLAFPKPAPQRTTKARLRRQERAVAQDVRQLVADRDGYCRLYVLHDQWRAEIQAVLGACSGPSEWAHLRRRSATRGMAAEDRHDRRWSLMLCRGHHQAFDAHRFDIDGTTVGADGPLRVTTPLGEYYQEPPQ